MATVRILENIDRTTLQQINSLLLKLDPSTTEIQEERMLLLLEKGDFKLFIAEDETGEIEGMLTLTCCDTLSRSKYWIEDVIVDEKARGHGTGRSLVRAAISYVRSKERFPVVYLTSNPSRVSARNLYRSEGFEEYETGVFRLIK